MKATALRERCADIARALRGATDGAGWRVRCPLADRHRKLRGSAGPTLRLTVSLLGIEAECDFGCDAQEVHTSLARRGFVDGADVVHESDPEAAAIWKTCKPIAGTLGERYIRELGIGGEIPRSIRFRPPGAVRLPMVAAIVQAPDARPIALHLILLDRGVPRLASPQVPSRITIGALGNGAVRLAPAGPDVMIAETVEEALAATQAGKPTWASLGYWRAELIEIPSTARLAA